MIRKILVPVRTDGKAEQVLGHAAALARRFGAHVAVAHARPRPEDMLPFGVPIPSFLRDQLRQHSSGLADVEEGKLRSDLEAFAQANGLATVARATPGSGASMSWLQETGRQIDVIKRHGRLADIVVVAKPDRDANLGTNTLRVALFNTGRPVLMCPPKASVPADLGDRVAIAWNGSLEATRAVTLSIDLIEKASAVLVLTANAGEIHGASADDLVEYLALRGVRAELKTTTARGAIGDALLQAARDAGADLLIMGAYGESHERETMLGGNSQRIVDTADMPVVMVH